MTKTAEIADSVIHDYRREASARINRAIGQVLNIPRWHQLGIGTVPLQRQAVVLAREIASDYGLFYENTIVANGLKKYHIPHADANIVGEISTENHPGLASAHGVLNRKVRSKDATLVDKVSAAQS